MSSAPGPHEAIAATRRRERAAMWLLVSPAALLMALVLVLPLAWLLALSLIVDGSFGLGHYAAVLVDPSYARSLWLTVWVACLVTGLCVVLGYAISVALTLMPGWLRAVCLACVALPFWTSVLVRTYAWLVLLQSRGVVNKTLLGIGVIDEPLRMMHNLTGATIGMVHIMLPFLVFPLYAQLARIDPAYVRAALSLGASGWMTFWRVYLPLSLPGLGAGAVLVFILSLGFYITPALLGGGRTVFVAIAIERDVNLNSAWGQSAAVGVLFAVAVFLLLAAFSRFLSLERIVSAGDARR